MCVWRKRGGVEQDACLSTSPEGKKGKRRGLFLLQPRGVTGKQLRMMEKKSLPLCFKQGKEKNVKPVNGESD